MPSGNGAIGALAMSDAAPNIVAVQTAAARALGISFRMWRYYEAGSHLLPKTVRLAALGLDAERRPPDHGIS